MKIKPKLLVISGPTATGKTKLALELAKTLNGELVSADSRQVYKGMDIGTGKDLPPDSSQEEKVQVLFKDKEYRVGTYQVADIPLWLYDVVRPDEEFSVAHYKALANFVIADMHHRGKLPIMVGGTGLYIKAVLEGIETAEIPRNSDIRKQLENKTVLELQLLLHLVSPESLEQMNNSDRNNSRRLIRKIEIAESGKSEKLDKLTQNERYDTLVIGLTMDRNFLQQKIYQRVNDRVRNGSIEEIIALQQKGYSFDLPALNTMGYKEWKEYLKHPSESEKQLAIDQWTHDEIAYAKKQMTWFKKQPDIHWFDISQSNFPNQVSDMVKLWYTK